MSIINITIPNMKNANLSPFASFVLAATRTESPIGFTAANLKSEAGLEMAAIQAKSDAVFAAMVDFVNARSVASVSPTKEQMTALTAAQTKAKEAVDAWWYIFGTRKSHKAGQAPKPLLSFNAADLVEFGRCIEATANVTKLRRLDEEAETLAVSEAFLAYLVQFAGHVLRGETVEAPNLTDVAKLRKAKNAEKAEKAAETRKKNGEERERKANTAAEEKAMLEAEKKAAMASSKKARDEADELKKHINDACDIIRTSQSIPAEEKVRLLVALGKSKKTAEALVGVAEEAPKAEKKTA